MNLSSLRIIFMGTPEFAVASLDALVQSGCNIVAVITAPDKPAGRGMQMTESAVKKYALGKGLQILQPEKLKAPAFLEELASYKADLQAVVAFRMLPEAVWNMPPLGTINLHGSLLPQYRGAAPINWAVINGEERTGVTTFKLQQAIDTGNILLQESFPIGPDETAGEVHDRMKEIGARLLVKTIEGLAEGTLKEIPQDLPPDPKHAPKIFTETCKIDWNKTAAEVHNLIRGLSPFPGAFTYLDGKLLKVYRSAKESGSSIPESGSPTPHPTVSPNPNPAQALAPHPGTAQSPVLAAAIPNPNPGATAPSSGQYTPGRYDSDGKTWLRFACTDGFVRLLEIQLEGKKRMKTEDFLRGYKLPL